MPCADLVPKVFFSNRLEVLSQQLKNELFIGTHPFTKRMIIVSSPAIKSWLMLQMAHDSSLGIAAGFDICFIDSAMHRLLLLLPEGQAHSEQSSYEPTELEISFAIEQEMHTIVHAFSNFSVQQKEIWHPLLTYLGVNPGELSISRKSVKRITALAGKLADYFLDYGMFGGRMIDKWNRTVASSWQQALWQRLETLYRDWHYPYRKFENIAIKDNFFAEDLQVHVFGLSYLAPVHHRFLMKFGKYVGVNYYLLSPCQKFWGDILSDKESAKLKAYWQQQGIREDQQRDLDLYLRDNNPLLSNFGKLGREMVRQIEEAHFIPVEKYALTAAASTYECYNGLMDDELFLEKNSKALSMLEAVQTDILLLRSPDASPPITFEDYDGTIQVHAAPKIMREVEAIYDSILEILHKEGPSISLRDIIVMVPNIEEYAPFIRSVFGAPDSVLDYQVMDLEMPAQNIFVQAFLHLLHLPLSRWDAVSLLRLFEYQAFQEKHRMTWEDVNMVRKWIQAAGIRWGKDHQHRNELLRRDHCNKEMFEGNGDGTWDYGLGRILEGLTMLSEGDCGVFIETSYFPMEQIEPSQSELLGKVAHILRSLLEDLRPLNDGTQLTIKEWSLYLKCLCETYFAPTATEENLAGFQMLMQEIEVFDKVSHKLEKSCFEFHSIRRQLELALNKKGVNHRELNMQAIRFCSLLPMRSIPAKVLVLMGMNDGAFPRVSEQAVLNCLLNNQDADYFPLQSDFDRFLFLEALLSARCYLLLSYIFQAKGDSQEQPPSLLVQELLSYLDKSYRLASGKVSQRCIIKHSFFSFDQRYFKENFIHKSYRKFHYDAALAYYNPQKQTKHQFISAFNVSPLSLKKDIEEVIVDINELMSFSRNPLKMYFNKSLGIYLEKEGLRVLPCDEAFQLSYLDMAIASREALFSSIPQALLLAEKMGKMPFGPFRKIGAEKISKEAEYFKLNLKMHDVDAKDIFAIEFSDRFLMPQFAGNCWKVPGLHIVTPQGTHVKLVGRIEKVSNQGLIFFGEDTIKDAIKAWPAVLVLSCLVVKYQMPISTAALFIKEKSKKKRIANFDSPDRLLGRYLDYYFDSKKSPSPLLPEWIVPILSGNHQGLQDLLAKSCGDSFQPIYDEYLIWIGRNAPNIDAAATIAHWQSKAQHLFMDLSASWYPKLHQLIQGSEDENA